MSIIYLTNVKDAGYHIKQIRKTRNLCQSQLAELCNITSDYIQKLENGKRNASLSVMINICNQLQCAFGNIYQPQNFPSLNTTQNDLFSGLNTEEISLFISLLNTYSSKKQDINTIWLSHKSPSAGEKIKQLRKLKNISQKKLASECCICYDTLKNIESGNNVLTIDNLLKISAALNVVADFFISDQLENKSYAYIYLINNIFSQIDNEEYEFLIETATEIKKRLFKRRMITYCNSLRI